MSYHRINRDRAWSRHRIAPSPALSCDTRSTSAVDIQPGQLARSRRSCTLRAGLVSIHHRTTPECVRQSGSRFATHAPYVLLPPVDFRCCRQLGPSWGPRAGTAPAQGMRRRPLRTRTYQRQHVGHSWRKLRSVSHFICSPPASHLKREPVKSGNCGRARHP
jgi:hypothetical protein